MRDLVYRLEGIRHTYDGRQVLRVDELDIVEGEVLALVGPSGAGKSTLLRLLGFLEPPDAGTVSYRSAPFRAGSLFPTSLRRRVTMVFQQPYLLNRSVVANVEYGLRLRKVPERRQKAERMLSAVGLGSIARQPARSLSGGEAQRVAMARALVLEPDVLLLDEPTANLDPRNVALLEDIILRANREKGTTIVLVTHNIYQARRMADRVGFLLDGQLAEAARAETFFQSPRDSRAAAFVAGEMVY